MSKSLVTGGAGFIGSHLVDALVKLNHKVVVLDDFSTGNLMNLEHLEGKIEVLHGSVSDKKTVELAAEGVDYIFHEAAQTSVVDSIKNPVKTWDTNIKGTKLILNAAVNNKVKKVMIASSANIYGNDPQIPKKESMTVKPTSPYGESKLMDEIMAEKYLETDGLRTVCLRYFNCYDKKTEILTMDGFKLLKDITYFDMIATLNPFSDNIEYYHPLDIQKIRHNGDMIHFKGKRIDLMVTPDNNMYTKSRKNYYLRKASEIVKNNRYYDRLKQNCTWRGKDIPYEVINKIENEDKPPKKRIRRSNMQKKVQMKLWVKFLGWFLTEGSVFAGVTKNYGKPVKYYRVSISQKGEKNCMEIIKICKMMGYTPYRLKNKRGVSNINIASKQLYEHLKHFIDNKHIPRYVLAMKREYLSELFKTLMKGDGNRDGSRFTTKYPRFADDFQELLLKIGKCGRIIKENNNGKTIYRTKISKNTRPGLGDPKKKTVLCKIVKYNDYVYDVSVPNHIIFVRRNGFACWSGNCYGPRQTPNSEYSGVISKFVKSMMDNQKPIVFGDGNQTRDFVYVEDVVNANLLAMKNEKANGKVLNIATGKETSINELIRTINEVLGTKIEAEYYGERLGDIKNSVADISQAKKLIGFKPKYTLKQGLERTINWFKTKRV